MEILEENVFKDISDKAKQVFGSIKDFFAKEKENYEEYKEDPKHLFYHEVISKLSITLQDLNTHLTDQFENLKTKNKEPVTPYNKMESVGDTIRSILGYIKEYKSLTKDNSLSQKVYKVAVEPLHSITKETRLIDVEKMLIEILQKLIKMADFYQDDFSDDEHSAKEKYKNIFLYFPTDDFEVLSGLLNGKLSFKNYRNLDTEYTNRLKKTFDKNLTKTTDTDKPKDQYASEWSEDSPEQKFRFFVDDKKDEDFETLWDTKFKHQWKEQYKKEAEKEREQLAHLTESIQFKIMETFLKD